MTTNPTPPGPDAADRRAAIRADLEFARASHLSWAEHLEAHAISGDLCSECEGKPYKLNAEHEREWVAKYDRMLAQADADAATIAELQGEKRSALEAYDRESQWRATAEADLAQAHARIAQLKTAIENLSRYEAEEIEGASGYFLDWADVKALLP